MVALGPAGVPGRLIRHAPNGYPISSGDRMNMDGTCFKRFDIRSFPKELPLVLAISGPRSAGPSHHAGALPFQEPSPVPATE